MSRTIISRSVTQTVKQTALATVLAWGAGLQSGPAAGQTVGETESSFADWKVTCPGGNECVAIHAAEAVKIVAGPGGDDGGMRFAVLIAANAGRGAPVGLKTPDGTVVQLRTQACTDGFCEAAAAPDAVPALLERLSQAGRGTVAYPTDGRIIFAEVSFDGFGQALRRARDG
jgi:hypothetical protein